MGGNSSEREISIKSGENIYKNLKELFPQTEKYILEDIRSFYKYILENNYDFIFLALHGKYGEDGIIQSFLESLQIPFSFSNFQASLIGFNKMISNLLIEEFIKTYNITNLYVPNSAYVEYKKYKKEGIQYVNEMLKTKFLTYPLIVKPNLSGSSVNLSLVEKQEDLKQAIEMSFNEDPTISVIQEYINGREITVGVIEKDNQIIPLEPCELKLNESPIFDYKSKYVKVVEHIIPPELPESLIIYLKNLSKRIFEFMNFKDAVRIDYRLNDTNKLYFLEANTIPGFTENSLLPQEAQKSNINFKELLKIIVSNNTKHLQKTQ
jgi:D-alanine-D-alanine ligase